jgi:hypothetical protein
VIGDGEQSRQHFVHGFLEQVDGIDFANKVEIGIRNDRYKAMVPQVVAPLRLKGRVHATEARLLRAHTSKQDQVHPARAHDHRRHRGQPSPYADRVAMAMAFAELLNQEALALQADGVDIIQFDEPAFNVYLDEAATWGVQALERAAQGLTCTTAVHICYGYGIEANIAWKKTLGDQWRQYETVFPALARQPHRPGQPGMHPQPGAARADGAADRQGRDGRRDRRGQRRGGDEEVARGRGRHHRPGTAVRAQAPADRLHQLRPGADAARRGRSQAARSFASIR